MIFTTKKYSLPGSLITRAIHLAALLFIAVSCSSSDNYISISGYAQGGTYVVKLNLSGPSYKVNKAPEDIKEGIDSILSAIDNSLSGYNPKSLLTRFNSGETIVPDSIFLDIYNISYKFYQQTGGAFDVAAGPLFDIWGFGFKEGTFPTDDRVSEIRFQCGMSFLVPDIYAALSQDGTLSPGSLLRSDAPAGTPAPKLNYNAVAQGYSCDLVAKYLYALGVRDMLVDIGGEIFCDGLNPSGKPWTIGIDKPVEGNNVMGAMLHGTLSTDGGPCGVVTSGNYRKFYVHEGRKYAHTVDPRTGYPVADSLLSATVIAEDATEADALATYCMVIGYEQSKAFISSRPDLRGYLIFDQDSEEEFGTWMSE